MMQAMTRHQALILSFVAAMPSGCSTSFWFTAVQSAAYDRRGSIKDADERARCKSANYPDAEEYEKDRASAGS